MSHRLDRSGMELWNIATLSFLKTGLDCDWDRLEWMANKDGAVHEMRGVKERRCGFETVGTFL